MAVKPGHLNSVRKIYFKRQKWNSYGKKQSTLFFFFFKKLHVTSLEEKLRTYGHNWFEHICWRKTPKQLLKFIQKEDWRPLKRVLDDMNDETETDKPGLNLWWNIMMMVVVSSKAGILSHFSLTSTIVVLLFVRGHRHKMSTKTSTVYKYFRALADITRLRTPALEWNICFVSSVASYGTPVSTSIDSFVFIFRFDKRLIFPVILYLCFSVALLL
jgi:hypothetical protein